MAKRKSTSHAGPHKSHGPKRHTFNAYGNKCIRIDLARAKEYKEVNTYNLSYEDIKPADLFSKYWCKESFILSCQARGIRVKAWDDMWREFFLLPNKEAKDEWLKNCKNWKPRQSKNKESQASK